MNITETLETFTNSKDSLEKFVKSKEFKKSIKEYGAFVTSAAVRASRMRYNGDDSAVRPADREWDFYADYTTLDGICIETYMQSNPVRHTVPVEWFTDPEAFKTKEIAKADALREENTSKDAEEKDKAKEARRQQFLALSEEFDS